MISEQMFCLKKNGEPYSNCLCKNPELIENYEKAIADTTQIWECHHRLEEKYSMKELKEMGKYYNISPNELIFLPHSEHISLHKKGKKCVPLSEEHKKKISESMKDHICSEETKKKISEANKGKTPNKGKSWKVVGKHWKVVNGKRFYY